MGAASYVTGNHNLRFGTTFTNGDWRLIEAWTGDVQPITYNDGVPVSVTLRLPDGRPQRHQARPRHLRAGPLDHGPRHLDPGPSLRPVHRRDARERSAAEPVHVLGDRQRRQLPRVRRREGGPRLLRRSAELEGHLAARGLRDGRVRQRPHGAQGERGALRQRPERRRRASGQPSRSVEPHRRSSVDRP